jgi:hypothetical protein
MRLHKFCCVEVHQSIAWIIISVCYCTCHTWLGIQAESKEFYFSNSRCPFENNVTILHGWTKCISWTSPNFYSLYRHPWSNCLPKERSVEAHWHVKVVFDSGSMMHTWECMSIISDLGLFHLENEGMVQQCSCLLGHGTNCTLGTAMVPLRKKIMVCFAWLENTSIEMFLTYSDPT